MQVIFYNVVFCFVQEEYVDEWIDIKMKWNLHFEFE